MIDVFLDSIDDDKIREAFKKVISSLNQAPFLSGKWEFLEFTVPAGATLYTYPHRLGFKPKDAIVIHQNGTGTFNWLYDSFTKSTIAIDGSSLATDTLVRCYVGEVTNV